MLGIGIGVGIVAVGGVGYLALVPPVADERISVEEALSRAQAGEIVLVDIRRPDEWAQTGVPAFGVAIDMRREDFVPAVKAAAGDLPVALICARGVRSRYSVQKLTEAGVTSVIDVPEGMLGSGAGAGWVRKNLPVVAFEA